MSWGHVRILIIIKMRCPSQIDDELQLFVRSMGRRTAQKGKRPEDLPPDQLGCLVVKDAETAVQVNKVFKMSIKIRINATD